MAQCYRVAQTYGAEQLPDIPRMKVGVQWRDPEVRNEATQAQVAEAHKRLDVPNPEVWRILGYTPMQIALFETMARAARAADVATIAGALRAQPTTQTPQTNPQTFAGTGG